MLGFLDLQAGQAQNRFYNDLEDWLSTYTRLSAGPYGEGSDASMPAYLHALLEQTADSMENLQRIIARSEEEIAAHNTLVDLSDRLAVLGEHMKAGQQLMLRLAESQIELQPSLTRLTSVAENSLGQDDVLRTHLRNIEAYVARLTEDVAEGRAQSVQELRGEIRLLARTIAGLAEEGAINPPGASGSAPALAAESTDSAQQAARNDRAPDKPPFAALEHRHLAGLCRCPGAIVNGHHFYPAGVYAGQFSCPTRCPGATRLCGNWSSRSAS